MPIFAPVFKPEQDGFRDPNMGSVALGNAGLEDAEAVVFGGLVAPRIASASTGIVGLIYDEIFLVESSRLL